MTDITETVELITLSSHDYREELAADVARGLVAEPKSIPSKYFYDARGGELFDRITELPEYYLTRVEKSLLEAHSDEIIELADPTDLLELGSGSADKTALLLSACGDHKVTEYAGLDVNAAALAETGRGLRARFPDTAVTGLVGDFVSDLDKVPPVDGRRLILFFGSTIGNLAGGQRTSFLRDLAGLMTAQDTFLLGVDLVKDPALIKAAYDDSAGLTAEFTRNVLRVINRELDADFPVDAFEHVPVWDSEALRMEAWLRSSRAMTVTVRALDMAVSLAPGEEIHTEVSCKFTREMVESDFAGAGLHVARWLGDIEGRFALALGRKHADG